MSTPITCMSHRQDTLFHILYCADTRFIMSLIEECVINISREYSSPGVHDIITRMRPDFAKDTLDILRAKFYLLLHQDMLMRRKLAHPQGKSSVIKEIDAHKAERFYADLDNTLIPEFVQDHSKPISCFINRLRDTYTCS